MVEEQLQSANEVAQTNPIADVMADGGVPVEEGHQEQEVQQEYAQEEQYEDDGYYQDPDADAIPEQNVESQTSHVDWESETKKFQSMYDKAQSDNQKMQDLLMQQLETQGAQQVGQQPDVGEPESSMPSEDEFSPWDAYYKPNSPSYNLRVSQENDRIDGAVQAHMTQLNNQMVMNNTVKELRDGYNMEESEVRDFMEFATTPRGQLPLETLVKVWGAGKTQGQPNPTLEKVKANRNIPRTAGVLQGQKPQPAKNEAQKTWENIMATASTAGSKIP